MVRALEALTEALSRLHELQREHDTPDPQLIHFAPERKPFTYHPKIRQPFHIDPDGNGNNWLKFHFKDFPNYARGDAYPYCRGFAYMPGIQILPVEGNYKIVQANDVNECCQLCADMWKKDIAERVGEYHDAIHGGWV